MMEPTWRHELQCIKEDDHVQYITAMLVWFHQWKQDHGQWPLLPACDFRLGAWPWQLSKLELSPSQRKLR